MRRFPAALVVLTAGCAMTTMQDAISGKARGTTATYRATEAAALEAARQVFLGAGADPVTVEGNRVTGASLTHLPETPGTPALPVGTYMAAWVEPDGACEVRVTVVTERRSAFRSGRDLSEKDFHRRMRDLLGR